MARFIMRILSAAAPYGRPPAPGGRERALVYLVMECGIVIYFTQTTDSVNPGFPCALNKPLKARNMRDSGRTDTWAGAPWALTWR